MNILETKGLYHDFKGLEVLFNVNLQVKEGERHAVIGPNGAGKTTLFNLITGTYRPSRGKVIFKNRDITGARPHELRRLTEGKTVVIIEHDMDVVFSLADRITVLHRGEILATGAPEEIRRNQAVKDAYLGEAEA
jgi:ABC-type branched-subunit amino acid transport system ATPase component